MRRPITITLVALLCIPGILAVMSLVTPEADAVRTAPIQVTVDDIFAMSEASVCPVIPVRCHDCDYCNFMSGCWPAGSCLVCAYTDEDCQHMICAEWPC